MDKKLLVILIIAALFFSITGVMADDSGSGGSDDSSDSSADDSSDDSSDNSMDDTTDDSIDTSPTRDDATDDRMDDSTDDSSGNSIDDSTDGSIDDSIDNSVDDSMDDSPDSAELETEKEIEHGIATIVTDENSKLSASPQAQPAIMTRSLVSLSSIPGAAPARIAELAGQVDDSYSHFSEAERSIRERSGILTFFFGGDDSAAGDIEIHVNEDRVALDEMEQIMNDPSASPALKAFAQARIPIIRAELARMQSLAAAEKQKSGLFG